MVEPRSDNTRDPDRRWFCRRYDDCLDVAVAENWLGFHCRACHINERVSWDVAA